MLHVDVQCAQVSAPCSLMVRGRVAGWLVWTLGVGGARGDIRCRSTCSMCRSTRMVPGPATLGSAILHAATTYSHLVHSHLR